ncbi:MAG: GxxExxY protein [Blastochloris sp.]|nr:GxxExxY protein [Blastochloris sp.]
MKADKLSHEVISAAIEVHKLKGPGLLEPIYQKCLYRELFLRKIPCIREKQIPIEYKGYVFEEKLRFDLLVDDCLLVETKSVEALLPIHVAQLLSYMKLMDIPIGLLINFHDPLLKKGLRRLILKGSDSR